MSRRTPGYTLLELVVVMAVLAMATAISAPPSYRMIRTWQEATQVEDVLQQMEHLPGTVRASGTPLEGKANDGIPVIALPEGWSLRMTTPLRVLANGACSEARGVLATTQQSIDFRVLAPFCRVERL
ncbi:MAG: type II secretion system GspH family protein [Achromobacter sp.]|uniref:pilus assembly FimT family protein n=1 Tax=Achromobacter sp. TaxID=134375 RepID=UPI00258F3F78|nr:type II secretion system protein [Achromobacter sp.]MCW0205673.1 type II secretion system GspH family protein [Achromobacter sp.]